MRTSAHHTTPAPAAPSRLVRGGEWFLSRMRTGRRGTRWILLSVVVWAMAQAGPARSLTPEEFAALEPEQALRLPVVEALEVFGWREREFVFVLENALIDLRYLYRQPSGRPSEQLTASIKAFQRETGRKPTGTLLVSEFLDLVQRSNELWQAPVMPGPTFVTQTNQVLWAEGTWSSTQAPDPDPIQTTSIRCYRDAGLCSMVTAKLMLGEEADRWFHVGAVDLALQARDWKVTQWSETRIDAEDRSALCVAYALGIDLREQRVSMERSPTGAQTCAGSAEPGRSYTLVSGYTVANPYWEARQVRVHKLRSPAFRKLVEKIQRNH